jgi:hypothetical protein
MKIICINKYGILTVFIHTSVNKIRFSAVHKYDSLLGHDVVYFGTYQHVGGVTFILKAEDLQSFGNENLCTYTPLWLS